MLTSLLLSMIFWITDLPLLKPLKELAIFAYCCFLQPLGKVANQQERLDAFYKTQAKVYDATRGRLLKGRKTMLALSAAAVIKERPKKNGKKLVWVDIGGGTGWNIENMMVSGQLKIEDFQTIYLVDFCQPLLDVARERFARLGWKNIELICEDAALFEMPLSPTGQRQKADLITMSYSFSMIPNFYGTVDRLEKALCPLTGVISVVDFSVSSGNGVYDQSVGAASRHSSWLARIFWLHWFELDNIDLSPARRQLLEWKFGTLKSYNGRNTSMLPLKVISIPYYVWLGCRADRDTSRAVQAFELDSGNTISALASPILSASRSPESIPEYSLDGDLPNYSPQQADAFTFEKLGSPLTAFHYNNGAMRVPYQDQDVHNEFRTWIYGFAWEDPHDDITHFGLTKDDTILCITSAGCNALHYAIAAQPKRINCVDMNPHQGHILELKIAAALALPYEDYWMLFGDGKHVNFRQLLDTKLSAHLTSHAYQYWRANETAFDSSFYSLGYSGAALRLVKYWLQVNGLGKMTDRFCNAATLQEQKSIWNKQLKPVLLGSLMKLICNNPIFLWQGLGVPRTQMRMFQHETTAGQYAVDTLDPIASAMHIKDTNYHYYLTLQRKYSPTCCPLYLTREGYETLRSGNGKVVDSIRIHTDSIINVLRRLEPQSLTVFVAMDHMDWFPPSKGADAPKKTKSFAPPCELTLAVKVLHRALKSGGRVFWRSAAMKPWYTEIFEEQGFQVEPISIREVGCQKPIDSVNMYASLYRAVKL